MKRPFPVLFRRPARSGRVRLRSRSGFSLLEMLIAIALLVLVSGALMIGFGDAFGGGQENVAQVFVDSGVKTSLTRYRIDMGRYPTTEEGLPALLTAPGGASGKWRGPYMDRPPLDPWGNPYQYRYPGTHNPNSYDVWSLGPDGIPSADDIGNWERDAS